MKKQIISVHIDNPNIDSCHQNKCKDIKLQTRIPASFHRLKADKEMETMVATSGRLKNHHPATPTPPPFLEKPRDPEGGAIYKALISYDCQQLYEAPEWTGEATPVHRAVRCQGPLGGNVAGRTQEHRSPD